MACDIRNVKNIEGLIGYFSQKLGWDIDIDEFESIEDITYDFDASEIGLKEESFAKISSLRQLQPLVDGQQWGIFCVEFDSNKFEPSALKKILSGLVPRRRKAADHAVWSQQDLLFICNWGTDNNSTLGVAHFEDREGGLPQIKMISCAPALEDFTQISNFENQLSQLAWPKDTSNITAWREAWSSAFTTAYKENIEQASQLTARLAAEAQNIRNRILEIMSVETKNGYVHLLYDKFRSTLIHDMTETEFADMYAQTVVYGLFSARCMDESQEDFSAAEAIKCIPNTNPFLKNLMRDCLGAVDKDKLKFDELDIGNVVDLLRNTRTDSIIKDFNRRTGGGKEDPVIHFYEEFLTAYDREQRVQRGVYYTPQPVVNFIVRAVDDILKTEFGYEDGLATTETKKIKVMAKSDRRVNGVYKDVEKTVEVPAVQILDPATGTGTFIRQVILQIYENFKQKHSKLAKEALDTEWNKYVDEHLLPRVNAFELMMAPYAVAHMKLAMVLRDTRYEFKGNHRLNLFLTNSLEKPGDTSDQISLFEEDPLATESVEANKVKKNGGINIVIGNPPYSCESANSSAWIQQLMEDFKKEPGGTLRLKEQNYKAINDDYVKFIRYSIEQVKASDSAIVSFINPHGFIDNPTFRGMRWNLLQTFSSLYIVELHGDQRRKEICPDGSKDENVFDIQQGVCILIGVKKTKCNNKCCVYRYDLYGTRTNKYEWLSNTPVEKIPFLKVYPCEPYYFFAERNEDNLSEYNKGFSIKDLFLTDVMGVATARDNIVIESDYNCLLQKFVHISDLNISDKQIAEELFQSKVEKANINQSTAGWNLSNARKKIAGKNLTQFIHPISYRPFDKRYIFYSPEWIDRDRSEVMRQFVSHKNIAICSIRINRDDVFTAFVSDCITDKTILSSKDNANVFPLYLFNCEEIDGSIRANLNEDVLHKIEESLKINYQLFGDESSPEMFFDAENLLDYIYAVMYSSKYRDKYKDQLKSEFPRIPYPKEPNIFWKLVGFGNKLRKIHLLTEVEPNYNEHVFSGNGDNVVEKAVFRDGSVFINKTQYFTNVSDVIWNEYVAAYQPLQKWMKDRKGMVLSEGDIEHYKIMIAAIEKTIEVMAEIDEVIEL